MSVTMVRWLLRQFVLRHGQDLESVDGLRPNLSNMGTRMRSNIFMHKVKDIMFWSLNGLYTAFPKKEKDFFF